MSRKVLSLLFVLALTILALSLTLNRASADRNADPSRQNGKASPDNIWHEIDETTLQSRAAERQIIPQKYKTFRLDRAALLDISSKAPMEFTEAARNASVEIILPLPDGKLAKFRIEEAPVMEPGPAAASSQFRSYRGQGIDDPTATLHFSWSLSGFHAQIMLPGDVIYIDPYALNDLDNYISYYRRDYKGDGKPFRCLYDGSKATRPSPDSQIVPEVTNGTMLRTYRMAMAATGEFTAFHRQMGDTDAQAKQRALDAIGVGMVRINGIYERDLSVRFTLVASELNIIYTDANTDPYNGTDLMLITQNQTACDMQIGNANYDIGHVISSTGAGVASSPSVCNNTAKAEGKSGVGMPVGDPFYVDYVAHEMGHQFGADHAYNAQGIGGCTTRAATEAYEPASGSTIMSYCGICDTSDLQQNSDAMFNVKGLEVMVAYLNAGGGCVAANANGNTLPTVTTNAGPFNIPKQTPFALTAAGNDANGDALTYSWEEYDLGPQAPPEGDNDGMARPILRVLPPATSPTRTFPRLQYILNNANVPPATYDCGRGAGAPCVTGERLPTIARTMNFQVVVRDNRAGGGGINTAATSVVVSGTAGPFAITAPNTAVNWNGNSQQTVTWNVNGTSGAPINAANVKISLSTDGGNTFPTTILASTPNDGSELITVPNIGSTTARIKVEAVGNIFFDISDANFTITGVAGGLNKTADFDGDGKTDISVFRPSNGAWYLSRSTAGFTGIVFGTNGDQPVPGDYDGDGKTDVAVYRPGTGSWYILNSSNGAFNGVAFGAAGDIPVPGRYDNDNKTDIAVFRPATGGWYILKSTDGTLQAQLFGQNGDVPMAGDFDGDGRTDLTVFRGGTWYLLQTTAGFTGIAFGNPTDNPVPADYDGDGKTDIAIYRTGTWYLLRSQLGFTAVSWGMTGDSPSPGDYDGDNKADVAVFRPSTGYWYILQSQGGTVQTALFGQNGDLSVPKAYIP